LNQRRAPSSTRHARHDRHQYFNYFRFRSDCVAKLFAALDEQVKFTFAERLKVPIEAGR
jgi:hypothetical protein